VLDVAQELQELGLLAEGGRNLDAERALVADWGLAERGRGARTEVVAERAVLLDNSEPASSAATTAARIAGVGPDIDTAELARM
jgi:hypothetical protein